MGNETQVLNTATNDSPEKNVSHIFRQTSFVPLTAYSVNILLPLYKYNNL